MPALYTHGHRQPEKSGPPGCPGLQSGGSRVEPLDLGQESEPGHHGGPGPRAPPRAQGRARPGWAQAPGAGSQRPLFPSRGSGGLTPPPSLPSGTLPPPRATPSPSGDGALPVPLRTGRRPRPQSGDHGPAPRGWPRRARQRSRPAAGGRGVPGARGYFCRMRQPAGEEAAAPAHCPGAARGAAGGTRGHFERPKGAKTALGAGNPCRAAVAGAGPGAGPWGGAGPEGRSRAPSRRCRLAAARGLRGQRAAAPVATPGNPRPPAPPRRARQRQRERPRGAAQGRGEHRAPEPRAGPRRGPGSGRSAGRGGREPQSEPGPAEGAGASAVSRGGEAAGSRQKP